MLYINGCLWTRTRNAEATDLQSAAMPIPLTHPIKPIRDRLIFLLRVVYQTTHTNKQLLARNSMKYKLAIIGLRISSFKYIKYISYYVNLLNLNSFYIFMLLKYFTAFCSKSAKSDSICSLLLS